MMSPHCGNSSALWIFKCFRVKAYLLQIFLIEFNGEDRIHSNFCGFCCRLPFFFNHLTYPSPLVFPWQYISGCTSVLCTAGLQRLRHLPCDYLSGHIGRDVIIGIREYGEQLGTRDSMPGERQERWVWWGFCTLCCDVSAFNCTSKSACTISNFFYDKNWCK